MKANEFIKKFGWEEAKNKVDDCDFLNAESFNFMGVNVAASDLKRLVESHELVFEHGSIDRARKYADSPYTAPEIKVVLDKAIADVESCQ